MAPKSLSTTRLLAPCGLNCAVCYAYLRVKNQCPGCRAPDQGKMKTCVECAKKRCDKRNGDFCFDCPEFPCSLIKAFEKRYTTSYSLSILGNLADIKAMGKKRFAARDKDRWTCPECDGLVCMHSRKCSGCGREM